MRLDIVIPAHNEEARIGRTLEAYRRACDEDVRFLVAMDDCVDRTADVVAAHGAADPRVTCLAYPKLGKGGVIAETFRRADADLVGFVDADGATPPQELLRLARAAEAADGAIASRRHPAAVLPARRPLSRQVTSAGFSFAVRRLMGLPYADTQCGAKVLRRDVVEAVLPRLRSRDLMFDVDLLAAARECGFRVVEVPTVWIDQEGSRVKPIADTRRMGTSLVRMWARRRMRGPAAAPRIPMPDTDLARAEVPRVAA
ncbi:MAG: dolichol-phosphate mannosyltransferase [Solirubrobacteraceae bacterium]|nr:dolichol-phosphate mannosyltransferase [Solirubrobacteraceae bacterium]